MPRYDFKSPRLFLDAPLVDGKSSELNRNQANYLLNVLRLKTGQSVLVFNGTDGEWLAEIDVEGRKKASLKPVSLERAQPPVAQLDYVFAPLKQARLDYMVQKAVEMGASSLQPVLTNYTQVRNLNLERMRANAIEAAEQCGILSLPEIHQPKSLEDYLQQLPDTTTLIFCDEGDAGQNPLDAMADIKPSNLAVLIGPEGGFSEQERDDLNSRPNVIAIPLGPRVLRADTAAVAALALVQAKFGDWRN